MRADIHSHLLWGIDDGARNEAQGRSLLSALKAQGTQSLALTPHYDPSRAPMKDFLARRSKAYEAFCALPETAGMTLSLGAELYLNDTIFNYEDVTPLCYTGTRLLLTELEYADRLTAPAEKRLLRLADEFGVRPVLAHVDRYPFFRKDLRLLVELAELGLLFQWNITSAMSFFGKRCFLRFYDKGLVHFLGEDVHRSVMEGEKKKEKLDRITACRPDLFDRVNRMAEEEIFRACQ